MLKVHCNLIHDLFAAAADLGAILTLLPHFLGGIAGVGKPCQEVGMWVALFAWERGRGYPEDS